MTFPEFMLAVVKEKPGPGCAVKQVPVPKIGANDVLLKIKVASICGTDVHIYNWDGLGEDRIKTPMVFGHECCGVVQQMGENAHLLTNAKVGDLVSVETHVYCGRCYQCQIGNQYICENVKIFGVDIPGVFAEYAVVPAQNLWVNDPSTPPEIASAQEPLGNAVHTVFDGEVTSQTISIFGCGPIGLCAAALCKYAGAKKTIAIDVNGYRLDLAKKMGADVCINASREDVVKKIFAETNGRGVDVFLEMSGAQKAYDDGFKTLRPDGRASLLGLAGKPMSIDVNNAIVFKAARVHGINGRKIFQTWHQVRDFVNKGAVDLNKIITHKFKLSEFEQAMAVMKSGNSGKVVLFP